VHLAQCEDDVIEHLHRQGERLAAGIRAAARSRGVTRAFEVIGRACNLIYVTRDPDGRPSQPYRTLFMQELIRRGILAPSLIVSYSHRDDDIDRTIEAVDGALAIYAQALANGTGPYLEGPPTRVVFDHR